MPTIVLVRLRTRCKRLIQGPKIRDGRIIESGLGLWSSFWMESWCFYGVERFDSHRQYIEIRVDLTMLESQPGPAFDVEEPPPLASD